MMSETGRPRGLLVSIHDVTPAHEVAVRELWELCGRSGIVPALLVVPDWHGQWPLESYPAYVAWLQARVRDGAEIILHGERHDEAGLPRTFGDSLRAVGRTAREGEFLTLDEAQASARITRGQQRLRVLGLEPAGFIPPAWLAREATHRAATAAGLRFSEDARGVRLLHTGTRRDAPAVRWSARTTARAIGSTALASLRWHLQRRASLVRLALHPQDLAHPRTAASVRREVERWSRHRPVLRYDSL